MKKINISLFAVTLAIILNSGAVFAYSCPVDMKSIDKAMKTTSLSMGDMERVKELRMKGEKYHKSGSHGESIKALDEAKEILGL